MNFVDSVKIPLVDGCVMEVQMTDALVDSIRSAFALSSWENLTADHVKHFLAKSVQNALETVDNAD